MIRKPETNGHGPARATTEIAPKATPAVRSAAQKLRILTEYETYPVGAPERGALLRREGIYTSHISKWRKQRNQGALQGLSAQRRGPKPAPRDPLSEENTRLRQENARLQARLDRAEAILEVQKKLSALLGTPLPPPRDAP
jgi:transposase-like protein